MGSRAWTMLGVLASLWGASYLFIKLGLEDLSPGEIAFLRIALGAVALSPIAAARGAFRGIGRRWRFVTTVGAIQVAGAFLAINIGEQYIASSLTGILVASVPLFTAIFAIRMDRSEAADSRGAVGIGLGLVGVALIVGIDLSGDQGALLGAALVLLGAVGYAVGGLMLGRDEDDLDPLGVAAGSLIAATVLSAPLAIADLGGPFPGTVALLATAALGILGTGVSFAIFYTLIAEVGIARAALVTYIAPLFAVLYGVVLLHERLTPAIVAGMTLVVGGSWLAAGRRQATTSSNATPTTPSRW